MISQEPRQNSKLRTFGEVWLPPEISATPSFLWLPTARERSTKAGNLETKNVQLPPSRLGFQPDFEVGWSTVWL